MNTLSWFLALSPAAVVLFLAIYHAIEGVHFQDQLIWSNRKVGGIRFMRFDRFVLSFCRTSKP